MTARRCTGCELCEQAGGTVVLQASPLRVLRVTDAAFPAFYRVVWNDHVAEFGDLSAPDRHLLMDTVAAVEQALRQILQPAKVNLASLGNLVPHLHWHVIARFAWDSHFPLPIWGVPQRPGPTSAERELLETLDRLDGAVAAAARVALGLPAGT